jgi:hypothetical protein
METGNLRMRLRIFFRLFELGQVGQTGLVVKGNLLSNLMVAPKCPL